MREGREADDADFVYSFYCNDVSNLILVVANGPTFCFETHDAKSMAASLSQSLSGFACVQLLRQLAFHKVGKMMSRCRQFVCFTIF